MSNVYAVIMAGGVGSRFWPSSRAKTPKQLLDLTGAGKTMIAATVQRLGPDIPIEKVLVVTNELTRAEVARCLPDLPPENILAEPVGRNTSACIGWAALHVKKRDPKAIMAVMPSDHLVSDTKTFAKSILLAVKAAQEGSIVTFGIVPKSPETGFGYIETSLTQKEEGVRDVLAFVEKPDLKTAKNYLEKGNFLWNSGMFFFSVSKILSEIEKNIPELFKGLQKIDEALVKNKEAQVLDDIFPTLPSISIDYGVMEKTKGILCVPVDFGWSDLGSWAAAFDLWKKDENNNALSCDAQTVDSFSNLVTAPKEKLVALVGVNDLIVVDTEDALLICKREKAQDVKKIVTLLEKKGRSDLL